MKEKTIKEQKKVKEPSAEAQVNLFSYRLKCVKTANGLSHYLMYGDIPEDKMLL